MRRILFIVSLVAFVGFGCASDDTTTPSNTPPSIRLLHMVYDGDGLDLRVNNQIVASGVTYGKSSGYVNTPSSTEKFDVSVHYAGDPNPRNSSKQTLTDNVAHTVYAFPPAAAFAAGFQADPRTNEMEKCRVKLANATTDNDTFELRITGSRTVLLGPVRKIQVAQYVDMFPGTYRFSLKKPKDTTWSMEFEAVSLQAQSSYTIVIHGTLSDADAYPFGIRMFNDNGSGVNYTDWVKYPSSSKLLFVHAVNGATPIDVAVDGPSAQVKGLGFGKPSPYMTLASGDHIYSAAAGSTPIVSGQPTTLLSSRSYSIFFTGSLVPPNIAPLQLEDETLPNSAAAMVRFVHLVPDAPKLDVYIKDAMGPGADYKIPGIDAVGFRETSVSSANPGSAFLSIPTPGTFTLKFVDASTQALIHEAANIKFEVGKITTLWIGGSTAAKNVKTYTVNHN